MSDETLTVRSLERASIRTRESGVTHSAWRMEIDSDAGSGTITLVDAAGAAPLYRGDGLFLGWSQEQLSATYQRLLAPDTEPPFEVMQLG
ncbi:MAG TPA: hypothetical protein VNN08_23315 [Thermoanaerobaculia bacterium]|nr:hypothetical protein [Thermoanaerobaculia bacterium]